MSGDAALGSPRVKSKTLLLALPYLAALVACAESKQVWNDFTANTKRAMRTLGKSCPPELPGRASGTAEPEGALGCFQKAVAENDPQLLLRVVCHSKSAASCKHEKSAEADARTALGQLGKHPWNDILGAWNDKPDAVKVYAIDNLEDSPNVSTVTLCRIAEIPRGDAGAGSAELGWAVCDVDQMPREAAKKKSDS